MVIPKYKMFDGERFQLVSSFGRKSDAKKDSERRRKLGYKVRTVKYKREKYYRHYNYAKQK